MRAGAARTMVLLVALLAAGLLCCEGLLSIGGPVVVAGPDATSDAVEGMEAGTDAGLDADAALPGTACNLPVPADASVCRACVAQNCCTQAAACAADPLCAALESCLLGCGPDYACRASCVIAHPARDITDVPKLDSCVSANCNGQSGCGMLCGGIESFTTPDAAEGCATCLSGQCASVLACASSLSCVLTESCLVSCSTQDCWNACLAADDGGFESMAFAQAGCLPDCQIGRDFRCVGNVAFPFATSTTSDVTLTVTNSANDNAPLPGLSVRACLPGEDPCSAVATGTTDAQGNVTLKLPDLPVHAIGFSGYFEITSTPQSTDIVPYLYFLSYPLSVAHATFSVGVQTPANFDNLVSVVGVSLEDAGAGTIFVESTDCLLLPAPDVTVAAAPTTSATRVIYIANGVLNAAATSTDISGATFIFNAPVGTSSVQVTPTALGQVSSQASIFVRAGAMSYVEALPTPN